MSTLISIEGHTAWKALVTAAQDFVDKVDSGQAHSVRSYAAFKEALELAKGITL